MRWDLERLKRIRDMESKYLDPRKIEDVSQCRICANLGEDHVPSEGSPGARVMLVGQSPGAREVEQGRPFCGPSGELVDLMLERAGLSRSEVYIANTLKCRPPGNRAGLAGEIRNCKQQWLAAELKSINPAVVVVVGKDAFASLIPAGTVEFSHKARVVSKAGRVYLVSYHPSWYLRRGDPMGFVEFGDFLAMELVGGSDGE
jgi:uracil-DNA glycosylase